MALEFAHGAIQWLTTDALNADLVVSGLSFQPKAVRFYWVGLQNAADAVSQTVSERRGVGFAADSGGVVQRAVGTLSVDAGGSSDCGSAKTDSSTTGVVVTVSALGVLDGRLGFVSFNSGGFTLNVDDVTPANLTVFWEAWGGSDITNVTIGEIAEPAATGNQNYTATGFTSTDDDSQVVMFAGVQTTGLSQATDSGLHVGFASGTAAAENVTICGNSDDASTTMDTDGYALDGECLSMIVVAGGNPDARAQLTAFGTNLFTLNWIARALTNRGNIYMAIKGGSWKAGGLTINGTTVGNTATVSGLSFAPKGISLISSARTESTAGLSTTNDRINLGSGSSTTSRRAMGVLDEDATANTEIDTTIQYDQVLAYPSATGTLEGADDINAMNSDGFQLIVDVADAGAATDWIGYLAFGDAPAKSLPPYRNPMVPHLIM